MGQNAKCGTTKGNGPESKGGQTIGNGGGSNTKSTVFSVILKVQHVVFAGWWRREHKWTLAGSS